MSPRRLLVVSDEMEVGGSQRQIVNLLAGLDRSRWQPELLYFRNRSFLVDEVERIGIPVHHLPKRGRIDPRFVMRYAALMRRGQYDIVHAFSLTAELWTVLAGMLVGNAPRVVSSVRGLYLEKPRWFWRLKRFIAQRSAAIVANARACALVAAEQAGVSPERFDVVPNGVVIRPPLPAPLRDVARHEVGCPEGRVFALFVGRQVWDKNLPCLLRAMARMDAANRPWLALAGDGPLRAELEATVAAAGLAGDVRFLGQRSDASVLMQAADFLVLPSRQEGMSNSILEAMAADCPVVASAVGGNTELVDDGVTGLLFPNDDDGALADALARMTLDSALRTSMGERARQRALAQFSIERMVAATASVYERCLAAPAARSVESIDPLPGRSHAGGDA